MNTLYDAVDIKMQIIYLDLMGDVRKEVDQ